MPDFKFGPWPRGIDNISEPTALADGAVVDAVNGWFKRGGHFTRRFNETLRSPDGAHSTWESPAERTYCVQDQTLCRVNWQAGLPVYIPLLSLPTDEPVSFATINDETIFASLSILGRIDEQDIAYLLGVEEPGAFSAVATAAGGLDAGRYGVAISYLRNGEEGALSDAYFLDVPQGGGIQFSLPTPIEPATTGIRVYRTPWNGDILYRAIDVPLLANVLIGTDVVTVAASTQFKRRMVGGGTVREWSGRIVVARGRTLLFSEAMRYGLRDARHGFIQMPERVTFVEALEGGIYVGTTKKVYFLKGSEPMKLELEVVDELPPVGGASLTMSMVDLGIESQADSAAVWLGANGYCVGTPDGNVSRPVSTIFKIPTLGVTGKLTLLDGVLTTVVH